MTYNVRSRVRTVTSCRIGYVVSQTSNLGSELVVLFHSFILFCYNFTSLARHFLLKCLYQAWKVSGRVLGVSFLSFWHLVLELFLYFDLCLNVMLDSLPCSSSSNKVHPSLVLSSICTMFIYIHIISC